MAANISNFRRKVALGLYELTGHAKEEMENDGFTIGDCKSAIYSGKIVGTQFHTGRRKHIVRGRSDDGRLMHLVCRITQSGLLRIITIYEVP